MKTAAFAAVRIVLGALLVMAGTGCAFVREHSITGTMWESPNFKQFAEPALPPQVALYERPSGGGVVVQYTEHSERHASLRSRAYVLSSENRDRTEAGKRPIFVSTNGLGALTPILPCADAAQCTNQAASHTAYAVESDGKSFTLYRPRLVDGPYKLPVYPETMGHGLRVALTPLTITADVAIYGSVIGIFAAAEWIAGGGHL